MIRILIVFVLGTASVFGLREGPGDACSPLSSQPLRHDLTGVGVLGLDDGQLWKGLVVDLDLCSWLP